MNPIALRPPGGNPARTGTGLRTAFALLWLLPVIAYAAPAQYRFEGVERIIAFGDVHGAHQSLVDLLRTLNVIDTQGRWSAGATHVVSLGDLLDRGPDSRKTLDLLMDLQQQAPASGGRLHLVLGNHETMNLTGDLRYVSTGEYAAFAEDESAAERSEARELLAKLSPAPSETETESETESFDQTYPPGFFAHRRAFAAEGRYGRWLLEQPLLVVINDIAFVHGGLPPWIAGVSLDRLNEGMRGDTERLLRLGGELMAAGELAPWQDLLGVLTPGPDSAAWTALQGSPYFGDRSPNWYRGTAGCHPLLEEPVLTSALESLKASRVVVGHSPTSDRRIQTRFDGRAILADTGMLASYYRGRSSAVVFESDGVRLIYPGETDAPGAMTLTPIDTRTGAEQEIVSLLETLDIDALKASQISLVDLPAGRFSLLFEPRDRQQLRNRLAAYRLDKLLGLGLVAPTVERRLRNQTGTLTLLPSGSITEVARQQSQRSRSNWCGEGNDYQLMYAFDTLIGNDLRSADQIHYDTNNWLLYLTGHDEAFGTSLDRPRYLGDRTVVLPPGLRERLDRLIHAGSGENLIAPLEDLLSKKRLRALLDRARLLLELPDNGN